MQKIRLQIMLGLNELNDLHTFQIENQCSNESKAISTLLQNYKRLQFIIKKLEEKAHEAEEWKSRAENKDGIDTKPIDAKDASKSTDLKQKSAENTLNIQQQNEAA